MPAFTIWNAAVNFDRGRFGRYLSDENLLDRLRSAQRHAEHGLREDHDDRGIEQPDDR